MNRYMRDLITLTTVLILGVGIAGAKGSCTLGSRYLVLAKARIASHSRGEAATFLRHAIQACPTYEANELLGELSEGSHNVLVEKRGARAFVRAYRLAENKRERAHTLYEYARLLDNHGDAQNASPLILRARVLEGADPEIQALAKRIESEVGHPTSEGIVRGLRDTLYVPLRLAALAGSGFTEGRSPVGGGESAGAGVPLGPSVNVPINFDTNSTEVDRQTRANIMKLAEALRSPGLRNRHFLFIGYADIRGPEAYNLKLSKERAKAIYQMLRELDPSLSGHVEVTGRGAADPIDPRHTRAAYRRNRRLQVLVVH